MKILGLCLFVLCLAMASRAQTPSRPANDDLVTDPHSQASLEPFALKSATSDLRVGDNADTFCAYMRTYRVKRKYRGSDEVRPAGYTKCVPTERFELRTAVQVEDAGPSTK
jgi:hypothetical protein